MWWIIAIWVMWSVVLLARHEHPINAALLPPLYAAGLMVKLGPRYWLACVAPRSCTRSSTDGDLGGGPALRGLRAG